jgi:uncharacterized protein with HEPN domain
MVKDNKIYISLILDSVSKIESFVEGFSFEEFKKDYKTQSAVLMQFQIIGELSKKINQETKDQIDLPWKEISGFRDVISHDYFNIDSEFVWRTLEKDIPDLKEKLSLIK